MQGAHPPPGRRRCASSLTPHRIARVGIALLLAWAAARSSAAGAPDAAAPKGEVYLRSLAPDLQAHLDRERLVMLPRDAADPSRAQGLVLFERPPAQVWTLLTQVERQREYRPELTHFAAVERFENGEVDRHQIRIVFLRLAYHLRYEFQPRTWRITWALDPRFENDVQEISGTWDLFEMPGDRTLGRFGTTVRVGAALPRSLQNAVTRKNVPEVLANVRQWVDSDGKWRP